MSVKTVNIDFKKVSVALDRIVAGNGILVAIPFLINFCALLIYITVYNRLPESTQDISIVIVPSLCLIMSYLVLTYHTYSTMIFRLTGLAGMSLTVLVAVILFGLIPAIGSQYDVLGISLDYWGFMSQVIKAYFIYITVCALFNFVVKSIVEDDETHG